MPLDGGIQLRGDHDDTADEDEREQERGGDTEHT
jgi:hypothetical protein